MYEYWCTGVLLDIYLYGKIIEFHKYNWRTVRLIEQVVLRYRKVVVSTALNHSRASKNPKRK